jgi:putative N6-adenine-specific DNA methylase
MEPDFDIFLIVPPGLEASLADEARAAGFNVTAQEPGGVTLRGGWPEVWRANLELRGAGRVLARIGAFRAMHLAQLDKRSRRFAWAEVLRPDQPVAVEATTRKSRIYHAGAARERIARAIAEELGAPMAGPDTPDPVTVMARIDDDLCTFSLDTSGELLHRRGLKQAVGKAPMRETMAALMLRACGFDGREPVLDPMCGSGTFVIEAAEIAAGLMPGRARGFAFERLASFDPDAWARLKDRPAPPVPQGLTFHGSDRDEGAIRGARANAVRAGVDGICHFERRAISDLQRPEGPPGLVMVNPPYGARIGNRKLLFGLYGALGEVLRARFKDWRVGLVTSDDGLAQTTRLPFLPPGPPISHGGLTVRLWQTGPH